MLAADWNSVLSLAARISIVEPSETVWNRVVSESTHLRSRRMRESAVLINRSGIMRGRGFASLVLAAERSQVVA